MTRYQSLTWRQCQYIIGASACFILGLAVVLGAIRGLQLQYENTPQGSVQGKVKCLIDVRTNITRCYPKCTGEEFSLLGMDLCHPWLTCDLIKKDVFVTDQIIGEGAVKLVKLGKWKDFKVAVSFLRDKSFIEDFLFNVQMLQMFNMDIDTSDHIVQLVGYCIQSENIVVTEYHPLGSAKDATDILKTQLPLYNTLSNRFSLCLDFVRVLTMLHNHKNGRRIFCDSNDPEKALSQFLLSIELHLLLNDMDALPVVNEEEGMLAKCGHRELYGDFVAPEQMWPYEDLPFNDSMMLGYTEKVDVWKIPDIFNFFLNAVAGSNKVKLHLFNIHAKCKNSSPDLRPTAKEVLIEYEQCFRKFRLKII